MDKEVVTMETVNLNLNVLGISLCSAWTSHTTNRGESRDESRDEIVGYDAFKSKG